MIHVSNCFLAETAAATVPGLESAARQVAEQLRVSPPLCPIAATHALAPLMEPLMAQFATPHHSADGGAVELFGALRQLGAADLSAGRLFEGHANALHLLRRHASGPQQEAVTRRLGQDGLIALWVADQPADPVRLEGDTLSGGKLLCSGAGAASAALITAQSAAGEILILLDLHDLRGRFEPASPWPLSGMQATGSLGLRADGLRIATAQVVGVPGAYREEPRFSGGMWRILALQLGALDRLSDLLLEQLCRAGIEHAPAQRQRILDNAIDCETVSHWVAKAAWAVEAGQEPARAVAYVGLAREVTLRAAEALMARVQRGLGAAALTEGAEVQRLLRDLACFLRQPAPDQAFEAAVDHVAANSSAARWP
ncbi:MAG: hypothetical protein H7345_11330 [Rubritepida sp.]|nr:hypothetical protein [Rubritepida sp.]